MAEDLFKLYRDRWKAVKEIERRENQSATIEQRWKQLNMIRLLDLALGIGRDPENDDEQQVYQRWAKLKQMFEEES